jgi:hypothetical protein
MDEVTICESPLFAAIFHVSGIKTPLSSAILHKKSRPGRTGAAFLKTKELTFAELLAATG